MSPLGLNLLLHIHALRRTGFLLSSIFYDNRWLQQIFTHLPLKSFTPANKNILPFPLMTPHFAWRFQGIEIDYAPIRRTFPSSNRCLILS
ncbi:MAG TPA: hypothetical protein PLX03_10355, partial [Candidatus Hydrogenedentes bacterium]|nr:hypothetical protein [Candidatus Hydrogenedentota bacterium]